MCIYSSLVVVASWMIFYNMCGSSIFEHLSWADFEIVGLAGLAADLRLILGPAIRRSVPAFFLPRTIREAFLGLRGAKNSVRKQEGCQSIVLLWGPSQPHNLSTQEEVKVKE